MRPAPYRSRRVFPSKRRMPELRPNFLTQKRIEAFPTATCDRPLHGKISE